MGLIWAQQLWSWRIHWLVWLTAGLALILGAGLDLFSVLSQLYGSALAANDVWDYLRYSQQGVWLMLRLLITLVLIAVAVLDQGQPQGLKQPVRTAILLIAGLALAWSFALLGHASASIWQSISATFHIGAAALWVTGLGYLAFGAQPARPEQTSLSQRLQRFVPWALASVLILLVSGSLNAWAYLPSWAALLYSPYGQALWQKWLLVAIALLLAMANHWWLKQHYQHWGIRIELLILVGVLLFSARLSHTPLPPPPLQTQGIRLEGKWAGDWLQIHVNTLGGYRVAVHIRGASLQNPKVSLEMADHLMEPIAVPLSNTDNQWTGQATLWMSGNWHVVIRQDGQEERFLFRVR